MRHTLEGAVVAVAADSGHRFSKPVQDQITLVKRHGVDGDAHAGQYVRHRYLARRHPCLPNLRQVHLIPSELFATVREAGYDIASGQLGENITTAGLDLDAARHAHRTRAYGGGRADRPADALRAHRPLQNRPKKTGLVVGKNGPCIQMRRPGRGASWRTGGSRRLRARSVRQMSEAASFAVALGKKEPSLCVTVGGDF
ncbi:hypothetical protein ABIF63_003461 [Bradyrhizobium japonicum]|uniref:MOSC domain-containing protein n=1 Tax=Bradyrhizobium japonicum TaxID=375 RepID=A0ABV2RRY3_BRAJP